MALTDANLINDIIQHIIMKCNTYKDEIINNMDNSVTNKDPKKIPYPLDRDILKQLNALKKLCTNNGNFKYSSDTVSQLRSFFSSILTKSIQCLRFFDEVT